MYLYRTIGSTLSTIAKYGRRVKPIHTYAPRPRWADTKVIANRSIIVDKEAFDSLITGKEWCRHLIGRHFDFHARYGHPIIPTETECGVLKVHTYYFRFNQCWIKFKCIVSLRSVEARFRMGPCEFLRWCWILQVGKFGSFHFIFRSSISIILL